MAMRQQHVIDRDRGYAALKRRWMATRDGRGVAVGIFGTGALKTHEDGVTNLLVAIVHEFGAPSKGVPSRSWLRAFVDEKHAEIRRRVRALAAQVVTGQLAQDQALGQLGAWIAGAMQARIANKIPPPLKASTVRQRLAKPSRQAAVARARGLRIIDGGNPIGADRARAGGDGGAAILTPLIDTGQFRQAITYEVRDA